LIQAVRYADDDLKMPPRGKLTNDQVANLVAWVKLGSPMPRDDEAVARPGSDFDLAERTKHWAYLPIQPIAAPRVRGTNWCTSPIDAFILARLEAEGLSPVPPAEKRTLIRRATFDLTGLPPTPDEVVVFLADASPDAYERVVDRLLASPSYGERFGRHWLDVVRYSETLGFEFDYDLHNAWRYRDYVIRAFNADLPYDQFVVEHLAGDLLPQPRRHALGGENESILATGFWWMHEGKQTPVDIRQDQADRIDNQLDVLGKAFLGQTIACARCHDHKFDAISTRDYYALAGYLRSSRYQQAFIDHPERFTSQIDQLQSLRVAIQRELSSKFAEQWRAQLSEAGRYMQAAAQAEQKDVGKVEQLATACGLDASRLKQWSKALADESLASPDHPLSAWSRFFNRTNDDVNRESVEPTECRAFPIGSNSWFVTGTAFGASPAQPGDIVVGNSPARPIGRLTAGGTDSGVISARLQGELRSPTFTIDKKFVHIRLAGHSARVNLVIDGYTLIMNPMYGKLTVTTGSDRLVWRTMPVDRWVGHRALLEASDSTIPMHGLNPPPSSARMPSGNDGYLLLDQVVFSDDANPPITPSRIATAVGEQATGGDLAAFAVCYQQQMTQAVARWQSGRYESPQQQADDIDLVNWLLENGLLDSSAPSQPMRDVDHVAGMLNRYAELEASLPAPQRAPAIADGTGEDEFVFLRGNYRTPGQRAPRELPELLLVRYARRNGTERVESQGAATGPSGAGSGRLDLARKLVDPANPLLPRVIVNRLWQHHFGEGIVRTPDDFGRMGQPPTHPELLDYLAAELVRSEWSLKRLSRQFVMSSTYRLSSTDGNSQLDPESQAPKPSFVDPDNRLLRHMPIRRLEAEAVRDAMLAVSGQLHASMHGPSVLPYLTSHMEGRGKPQSGPLDGEGRRSIYVNARRNFLTPLLLAFDYPVTFTPIGRRGSATIPAQALTLMNDPFVVGQAQRWAERTLAQEGSTAEQRIVALYQTAFSRDPSAEEVATAIDFLQSQSLRHGTGSDDPRVWTDLCHVLINVKEFIFIE
jgi:hypothetical protein